MYVIDSFDIKLLDKFKYFIYLQFFILFYR